MIKREPETVQISFGSLLSFNERVNRVYTSKRVFCVFENINFRNDVARNPLVKSFPDDLGETLPLPNLEFREQLDRILVGFSRTFHFFYGSDVGQLTFFFL